MWVLSGGVLVRYPERSQLPKGAQVVDVPAGFQSDPGKYKVVGKKLVRRSRGELEASMRRNVELVLTPEEIAVVKRAIKDGRI